MLHLRHPWTGAVASTLLVGAWAWMFAPTLRWIQGTLGDSDFRLNLLLALALGAVIVARSSLAALGRALAEGPRAHAAPLALVAVSGLAWLACERLLDIDLISSLCCGLAGYGILGLYVSRSAWWRGFPAALLLIGALPFGHQADIYVGFPARVVIARTVEAGLQAMGVPVQGTGTVLVVMSRAAQVDLPCAGVRSLWAGGLFFLAATWLERRRVGLAWLSAGVFLVLALFAANVLRVMALVVLDTVLGASFSAALVHVPLGVLGFGLACVAGWGLLRLCPPLPPATDTVAPGRPALGLGLAAALAVGALVYAPRPIPTTTAAPLALSLPPALDLVELDFTPKEADLFMRHGASDAHKWSFSWEGLQGGLIVVRSRSWRAHHPPTLCLQGQGFTIEEERGVLVTPDFPVRTLILDGGAAEASFWFQTVGHTTDDFTERTFAGVLQPHQEWVMVSMVVDHPRRPDDDALRRLHLALRDAVAASLHGARPLARTEHPSWSTER
ncbi:MAG: exosortase O [Alphaproteobacteria bacterium]|nr:exosortase O [Alphaproteobacteria bacterium]